MLWTFERTADTWTPSEALLYKPGAAGYHGDWSYKVSLQGGDASTSGPRPAGKVGRTPAARASSYTSTTPPQGPEASGNGRSASGSGSSVGLDD
ncbi:hypothetical protein EYF80_012478 [Liparis tanakae]|uniref:Uncharacterized protein n=1 Tax=Liparis tanakae TaxID=230148 RepID=A0A4Z2IIU8_9TELE|nr:hypothetical protein EYF80_012478 [Liparis tanakae]